METKEMPQAGLPAVRDAVPAPLPAELTTDDVVRQVGKVQDAMKRVMQKDVHYGVIPGTQKPSLLQPGAEKLCLMFRLAPDYAVECQRDGAAERSWTKRGRGGDYSGVCTGFVRYTVICRLTHGPSGTPIAAGTGTANNWEPKFISRDPFEAEETILQFARKRALVNAVRTGTAASDIFTQDVEDVSEKDLQGDKAPPPRRASAPAPKASPASTLPGPTSSLPDGMGEPIMSSEIPQAATPVTHEPPKRAPAAQTGREEIRPTILKVTKEGKTREGKLYRRVELNMACDACGSFEWWDNQTQRKDAEAQGRKAPPAFKCASQECKGKAEAGCIWPVADNYGTV